ncbi:MAG TPA: hypothetical protein VEA17_09735 [Bordetella sp.]|nr:hypothetical protein [Bordetella sp.]
MERGLTILQHALGVDRHGRGSQYRNHFVTGPGSTDYPDCMALVESGMMQRRPGSEISGGSDIFTVTETGKQYVSEHSPKPPTLTRAQRRYRYWLRVADCFPDWEFGDWLRSPYAATANDGEA